MSKTIISCAITGSLHTPTMSEALPVTPEAIGQSAQEGGEAGAAILHLHARNPSNGAPSGDVAHFQAYLPELHSQTDAVLNITTGGSPTMTVEERLQAAQFFQPEVCSLNTGSLNFAMHKLADRYDVWKEDWEEPFLRRSESNIFRNTFTDIREIAAHLRPNGTRFEHIATTSGIFITCAIVWMTATSTGLSSCSSSWGSWAASVRMWKTCCFSRKQPTGCWGTTNSRSWRPARNR